MIVHSVAMADDPKDIPMPAQCDCGSVAVHWLIAVRNKHKVCTENWCLRCGHHWITTKWRKPPCPECGDEGYVYWSATGTKYSHIEDDYLPVEFPMRSACPNGCKPRISHST